MKYLVVASGGPGFSSPEEALEVLEKTILPSFAALKKLEAAKKILAGGLPVGDRAAATLGAVVAAALRGAHFVRVHDVKAARHALAVADAIVTALGAERGARDAS